MKQILKHNKLTFIVLIILLSTFNTLLSQSSDIYPPNTKWYQDPLGLKPLQLSTAFGFAWGSTAVAACLVFSKIDTAFRKKISFYSAGGIGFGYKPPYSNVIENDIGILYEIRRWMAIGLEWNNFHFKDKIDNTWGVGINPLAKWYVLRSKRFRIFFQYGAGIAMINKRFPFTGTGRDADTGRVGTRFNFTSNYAIGSEVYITKKVSLQTSFKHFHLSNGNISGIKRNPSYDSNGFFITLIFKPITKQIFLK